MRRSKHKSFRRWIKELRELCPTIVPVRVRRRPLKKALGYASPAWDKKGKLSHFNIVIDSRQSWDSTWQVLVHEYSHVLAWQQNPCESKDACILEDHGVEWAIALTRVYQEMVDI